MPNSPIAPAGAHMQQTAQPTHNSALPKFVLVCQNLEKYYGARNNITKALDGINLSVQRGEFIAIMGPSGSGKTTLLNCISTIDQPTAGHIFVDDQEITSLRGRDLATFRRDRLGFIFQDANLLDTLTARENIALSLTIGHVSAKETLQRVEEVAHRLEISEVLDKFPHEMSGGQRQRVAAARAIVTNPSLVLADEPTGSLDSKNARALLESFEGMNRTGATIAMVTHDSFAASYAHRVVFIKDGRIFNEIVRGEKSRKQFFDEIMDVVSFLGGRALMYAKIALGNVRKSIRDFSVYFLTLAIGVALFYAFNSITQQTVVLNLSDDGRAIVQLLAGVITGVSVFLAIVLGFLVVYANRFLIRRRKHEFGMYLTLGMTRQDVSKIIVLETLIVGVLALAVGLVAGVFGSQLMTYATARLFDAQIKEFTFVFSAHSCISTIVYFTIMFAVSLLFNVVTISRYKLIDLIDADKVSENIKVRNLAVSVILFIASLVIIGISYRMLLHNGMRKMDGEFAGATALVSVGTLLFFFSMSGFLLRFVQSRKSFYFRGLNAFTLRQFNSRVNTAWLSISMVCAMLFIAICGFCSGFSLVEAINAQFKAITSVDATLSMTVNHSMDPKSISTMDLNELARSRYPKWDSLVDTSTQVDFYMVKDSRGAVELNFGVFAKHAGVNPSSIYPGYVDDDMVGSLPVPIITASQYNRIRQINGLSPVDFGQDGYLVWTTSNAKVIDFWKKYSQDNKTLDLYGTTYHSVAGGYDDKLRMPGSVSEHSATGTLVVSDNALPKEASLESSVLFVNYAQTKDAGEKTLQDAKKTAFGNGILLGDEDKDEWAVLNLSSAKETAERTSLMTAAVTYLALYIGFILLIACASIFALQQLSEASDNVRAYRVLAELGAERSTANRALFIQIGVHFLLPLIVASAHAFVALSIVADVVSIVGGINIASSLVGTIALVLAVYGGYFLLTYFTARSIIFRGNRRIS